MKKLILSLAACAALCLSVRAQVGITARWGVISNSTGTIQLTNWVITTQVQSNLSGVYAPIYRDRGVGLYAALTGTNANFTNSVTLYLDMGRTNLAQPTTNGFHNFIWTLTPNGNATYVCTTNVPKAVVDNFPFLFTTAITNANASSGSLTLIWDTYP